MAFDKVIGNKESRHVNSRSFQLLRQNFPLALHGYRCRQPVEVGGWLCATDLTSDINDTSEDVKYTVKVSCHIQFRVLRLLTLLEKYFAQHVFNAVLIRLVAQVKISLLLKIQWQKCYNLYESFVYKFCLKAGKEVRKEIGMG